AKMRNHCEDCNAAVSCQWSGRSRLSRGQYFSTRPAAQGTHSAWPCQSLLVGRESRDTVWSEVVPYTDVLTELGAISAKSEVVMPGSPKNPSRLQSWRSSRRKNI